jgi:DHA1 family putative efflux transporter-like MFS transporter
MLTLISFLVGTSQFVIVGILDKVAASVDVSVSAAGQLISVFALANAIGTPVVMVATAMRPQTEPCSTVRRRQSVRPNEVH